jgi:hypothetical protein
VKVVALKLDFDGHADHGIVVDDKNTWLGLPGLKIGIRRFINP